MLSFLRRKKPQNTVNDNERTKNYNTEELATAFPNAAAPDGVRSDTLTSITPSLSPPEQPASLVPLTNSDAGPVFTALTEIEVTTSENSPESNIPQILVDKPSWRDRLRNSVFARNLDALFSSNPRLDDHLLDEIETALITADVGVSVTNILVEGLRKRMSAREFADVQTLLAALRAELIAILRPVSKPLIVKRDALPYVFLVVGVNGVGKTTTIGKLCKWFKDNDYSLILAAGDTFRAAAVAQLQAWGQRNGMTVIAQKGPNADAASVVYDALQAAKARGVEVLIADTAGRLHTQSGLMNELSKIRRVLSKLDHSAPHEVLMVIDGTTGQNVLSQLHQFHAAVNVTGLVVTKLDGTAKGGVVFTLAREFGIPIYFIGIGEQLEDMHVFDPEAFVDVLLPRRLGNLENKY
ncbi:MAG TPA: signal recognition particle-docking protein FtsY [Xylella sp.]